MPANAVHGKREERLWNEAKAVAEKEGKAKDYAYIMGIFERMRDRVGGGKPLAHQAAEALAKHKQGH